MGVSCNVSRDNLSGKVLDAVGFCLQALLLNNLVRFDPENGNECYSDSASIPSSQLSGLTVG